MLMTKQANGDDMLSPGEMVGMSCRENYFYLV